MRPAIFDSNVRDGTILIEISNMKNEKYQSFKGLNNQWFILSKTGSWKSMIEFVQFDDWFSKT